MEKCEVAFQQLKEHLGKPPLLSKPIAREWLFLYLAVSESPASSVLVRDDNKVQHSVYYVSKRLLDTELRYPDMEKLAYALVISFRKLRPYFQAHTIEVLTSYPISPITTKARSLRAPSKVGSRTLAIQHLL